MKIKYTNFSFARGRLAKLVFLTITFLILTTMTHPVLAYDLTVTCDGSGCDKDISTPLFDSSTIWYPTLSEKKEVQVINNRTKNVTLSTNASGPPLTHGALDEEMMLTITQTGVLPVIWEGTVHEFFADSTVPLPSVPGNNGKVDLTFTMMMNDVGNEYQNTDTTFDLNFIFEEFEEEEEPSPIPPTPEEIKRTSTDGGGGGGTTTTTTASPNTPVSPITQLVTLLPRFFIPAGPTVAGAEIKISPTPEPEEGKIEGIVAGAQACTVCFWWPLLVLQFVILLLHYYITRKKNPKPFWIGGILTSVFIYILFLFFNRNCRNGWQLWIYTDVFWCKYFIIWVLLIFGIMSYIFRPKKEESYEIPPKLLKNE